MDDLIRVKQVIADVLADLTQDTRKEIKTALANLFQDPVINFPDSYTRFVGAIGQGPDVYDRWLNLQMQVFTDLGPDREELIILFKKMIDRIIKETPGGETFIKHKNADHFSHTCALMFRVYVDTLVIDLSTPPPLPATEEGDKA